MSIDDVRQRYLRAINRLGKWRSVFAGWQLGTRLDTDPECQAVREQFNTMISARVELNALTALLIKKQIITEVEFMEQMIVECDFLHTAYEKKFPGFRATDSGMHIDTAVAAETMKGWRR
jgi:hypothetical protein